MKTANNLGTFLQARRARLQPEEVGLPRGSRRRVRGLRREEVASLAGVSLDYYVQVERGRATGVSDEVLAAIASALLLNELERQHLFQLARGKQAEEEQQSMGLEVPPSLQGLLDSMLTIPAVILSGSLDILAANALGRAFYSEAYADGEVPNLARYVYCRESARSFYSQWEAIADDVAILLRQELARSASAQVQGLIDDLSRESPEFAARWAQYDLGSHDQGLKLVRHPLVGELVLTYEALEVASLPGARLFAYTPAAGHPETARRLEQLAGL